MDIYCRLCRQSSPADAFFCVSCGSVLHVDDAQKIRSVPGSGITIRRIQQPTIAQIAPTRQPARPSPLSLVRWAGIPIVGMAFSLIFLFGILQLIDRGGLPPLGLWGLLPVVTGALLSEEEWVNGKLGRGLLGMAIWGGIPWLLAGDLLSLAVLLGAAWLALRATRSDHPPLPHS
jgi:hypothetical protein